MSSIAAMLPPSGMESYLGTVLTVKGHNRAGFAELAYASFLCNPAASKDVLKQGWLLKKGKRTERWRERFVALRAAFLTISQAEHRQGSTSKVYQVLRVVAGQLPTDLIVYTVARNHRECENIQLRFSSNGDRNQWRDAILHGVAEYNDPSLYSSRPPGLAEPPPAHTREISSGSGGLSTTFRSAPSDEEAFGNTIEGDRNRGQDERERVSAILASEAHSTPVVAREDAARFTFQSPKIAPRPVPCGPRQGGGGEGEGEGTVGVFWHCSGSGCLHAPKPYGHASAVNAVRAFATRFGHVDAVRDIGVEEDGFYGGAKGVRVEGARQGDGEKAQRQDVEAKLLERFQLDTLTWLWDSSAHFSLITLVLLTNLTSLSSLLKRVSSRGVRVVVVSDLSAGALGIAELIGADLAHVNSDVVWDLSPTVVAGTDQGGDNDARLNLGARQASGELRTLFHTHSDSPTANTRSELRTLPHARSDSAARPHPTPYSMPHTHSDSSLASLDSLPEASVVTPLVPEASVVTPWVPEASVVTPEASVVTPLVPVIDVGSGNPCANLLLSRSTSSDARSMSDPPPDATPESRARSPPDHGSTSFGMPRGREESPSDVWRGANDLHTHAQGLRWDDVDGAAQHRPAQKYANGDGVEGGGRGDGVDDSYCGVGVGVGVEIEGRATQNTSAEPGGELVVNAIDEGGNVGKATREGSPSTSAMTLVLVVANALVLLALLHDFVL